jgi:hemerythrin-like domain-containing protein
MTDFIARWRDEHVRFASLLDVLEAQLDRFHRGERPDYQLMFDVVHHMSSYADRFHHPAEDLAFAIVAEHDPQTRGPIGALIAEHAIIRADGEKLVELLQGALDEVVISRHEVEEPGHDYIARLRRHIRREELLFPFVAKWVKARDWAQIRRQMPVEPASAAAA